MAEEPRNRRENTFEKTKKYLWLVVPILLVFVSITSFIAGINLNTTKQPMGRIIDTIILSPDQKLHSIEVSGRLTYSDGSPYANQLLELHSTPVQSRTDAEGRFTFSQVVLGSHTLYLLNEGGEIISSLNLYVERTPEEKAGSVGEEGENYRIAAGMDTTALFLNVQVSPDHKLKIEKEVLALTSDGIVINQDGKITGTAVDFSKGIIEEQSPVPSGEGLIEPETDSVEATTEPGKAAPLGILESEQLQAGESNTLPNHESINAGISESIQYEETAENPKKNMGSSSSGGSGSSGTRPTKPSIPETTPEETKPPIPETTPEETKPSIPETTPEETKPSIPETTPEETKPSIPETTPEETKPSIPETTPEETKPSIPETTPEETKPSIPETTPEEPTEEMENVTVSDDRNESWTQNTTIDLFANRTGIGPEKKLAPGSKGSYEFQIANGNDFNVYYTITIEKGVNQKYLLPLSYRLKSNNEYISGSNTVWLTAEQLKSRNVSLATGGTCGYILEWQWPYEGGNDELDTLIGMSEHLEYELVVKIQITQS